MNIENTMKKNVVASAVAVFALFFGDCSGMRMAGSPILQQWQQNHNPGNGALVAIQRSHPVNYANDDNAAPAALPAGAGTWIARLSSNANLYPALNNARAGFRALRRLAGADLDQGGLGVLTAHAAPDAIPGAADPAAGIGTLVNFNGAAQVMFNSLSAAGGVMTINYASNDNSAAGANPFLNADAWGLANPCPFATFLGTAAGLPLHGVANTAIDELVALSRFVVEKHNTGELKTYVSKHAGLFPNGVAPAAIEALAAPNTNAGPDVNFLVCLLFHIVAGAEAGVVRGLDVSGNNLVNAGAKVAGRNGIGYTPKAVLAVGYLLEDIAGH